MSGRLAGKVAIVTGAAGGIGSAVVRRMVAEGASVVAADINGDGVDGLAAEVGPSMLAIRTDVTHEAAVQAMVEAAVERFGRLDVLHNNAVVASPEDTDTVETPNGVWQATFELVVMAAVYGCRHAIPAMLATGGGSIINTSSGAARSHTGNHIAYGSTKAALETMSAYTAGMYGTQGIRCNVIAPGFVLTPSTEALFDEFQLAAFSDRAAAGRVAVPDDIAEVAVFLASEESAYVSGHVLTVNGGGARGMSW